MIKRNNKKIEKDVLRATKKWAYWGYSVSAGTFTAILIGFHRSTIVNSTI
jgi:hypothetical protein